MSYKIFSFPFKCFSFVSFATAINKISLLTKPQKFLRTEFALDRLNAVQKMEFLSARLHDIVLKGENAGYQQIPCSHNSFKSVLHLCHSNLALLGKGLRNEKGQNASTNGPFIGDKKRSIQPPTSIMQKVLYSKSSLHSDDRIGNDFL